MIDTAKSGWKQSQNGVRNKEYGQQDNDSNGDSEFRCTVHVLRKHIRLDLYIVSLVVFRYFECSNSLLADGIGSVFQWSFSHKTECSERLSRLIHPDLARYLGMDKLLCH